MPSSAPHPDPSRLAPGPVPNVAPGVAPGASASSWRGLIKSIFSRKALALGRLERAFADHPEAADLAKALWLTRRARRLSDWGNGYQARLYLDEALRTRPDFFPAQLHLAALYRHYALHTGVVTMLDTAQKLLDDMPQQTQLLGRRLSLCECGEAVEAERSSLVLLKGDRKLAVTHARRALSLHQRAESADPEAVSFLESTGCRLHAPMLGRLQGRVDALEKELGRAAD
ncbi:MAG: hypothetical protein V1797_04580 [Pseudomonadota bacterium]